MVDFHLSEIIKIAYTKNSDENAMKYDEMRHTQAWEERKDGEKSRFREKQPWV